MATLRQYEANDSETTLPLQLRPARGQGDFSRLMHTSTQPAIPAEAVTDIITKLLDGRSDADEIIGAVAYRLRCSTAEPRPAEPFASEAAAPFAFDHRS